MTAVATEPRPSSAPVPKTPLPTDIPGVTRSMTYEEYVASPKETARYDIIGGYKRYRLYGENQVASPTRTHQRIQGNLYDTFRLFETTQKTGLVFLPPCDVLIEKAPRLRTRQPDMLFISSTRLEQNPSPDAADPLSPAPELVVEVLSPSDKPGVLAAKIADYRLAGVQEVWVLQTGPRTIEVVRLTEDEIETVAVYESGQTVESVFFPGLVAPIDAVFAV